MMSGMDNKGQVAEGADVVTGASSSTVGFDPERWTPRASQYPVQPRRHLIRSAAT